MKKWLKLGSIFLAVMVIAFIGISVYLGYSMTRQERVSIERNPGAVGLAYEEAQPLSDNRYKITIARTLVKRVIISCKT